MPIDESTNKGDEERQFPFQPPSSNTSNGARKGSPQLSPLQSLEESNPVSNPARHSISEKPEKTKTASDDVLEKSEQEPSLHHHHGIYLRSPILMISCCLLG